jgi:type IV secretory pathway VirB4 component
MSNESKSQKFQYISTGISVLVIPIIVAYYGNLIQERMHDKQLEENKTALKVEEENNKNQLANEYIKLAINILKDKPSENNKELRTWAVAVVNKYSDIKLSENTQKSLIEEIPLTFFEEILYKNTGTYTFKWNGDNKRGYELDIEFLNNGSWNIYWGYCLIGNEITVPIPKNQNLRWRVTESGKSKKDNWFYIKSST